MASCLGDIQSNSSSVSIHELPVELSGAGGSRRKRAMWPVQVANDTAGASMVRRSQNHRTNRLPRTCAASAIDRTTGKQYSMQDGAYEWDDAKAIRNRLAHDVSFEIAREVF